MRNHWTTPRWLVGLAAAAGLAFGAQGAGTGYPGIVNYVEGQVEVNGASVTPHSAGSADVGHNQVLQTENGKAEVLLTPGVFLRVGDNSAIRMLDPSLTNTRVQVLNGNALVEVTELFHQNHLQVVDDDSATTLLKKGVYEFNATNPQLTVFDGKAEVQTEGSHLKAGKGKEVLLAEGPLQEKKFDHKEAEQSDGLFQWSSLRSEYLAEASWDSARTIVVDNYPWWGAGWYWNPYWDMYSFIPADGFLFSPFGWGFYSPWAVWRAPGFYGGGIWGHRAVVVPHGRYGAIPRAGVMPRRGFAAEPPAMGRLAPNAGFRGMGGFGGMGRMGGGPRR